MKRLIKIYADSFKGLSPESWMLSIVMLINRAGSMVLPFLGVYMIDHLGFDIKHSGLVLSCFGVGSVIGSFIGGYITDKIGEYWVQVFSLLVSVPLFCLYPLFDTPIALGILVLCQSVVSELFRPANSVAIAKYATAESLTRAYSLNRMAVNLGFSIGPALGGFLAAFSYNLLFFFNAAAALIAAIAYILFFYRRQRLRRLTHARKQRQPVYEAHLPKAKGSPYTDLKFWVFCIFSAIFSICFFQLMSTIPLFYKNEIGLQQGSIGLLMALNGIVVVIFEMLLVHIAERKFSLAFTMLLGSILCAFSYFLMAIYPVLSMLAFSMAFLSLGEILILPFMSTITAMRSQPHNRGAYMGMNGISVALAFIISPILGTKIAADFSFSALWWGTSILLIIASLGFYFIVPKLKRN